MKLASISYRGQDRLVAAVNDHTAIDVTEALTTAFGEADDHPRDMLELIEQGREGMLRVAECLAMATARPDAFPRLAQAEFTWHPPVRRPGKICGVAMNNSASNDRKIKAPDHPAFFLKPASCLIGHGQSISIRSYYGSVHPEPELAVVVGREMRDTPAANALENVAGYTIMNDITGNGMRAEDMFHYWAIYADAENPDKSHRVEQHLSYAARYKGTDTFGVLGPWLVTPDEVPDPDDLAVTCAMGADTIAQDSTRYYNFKVAELLSFISQFQTLLPGDIVSCGTAFKPSANRKSIHNANFQQVEGPVSVTIERLGTQCNPIAVEQRDIGQWRLN